MKAIGDLLPKVPEQPRERREPSRANLPAPSLPHGTAVVQLGAATVPKPSGALERTLRDFEDPHPDVGPDPALATDPVREEAARHLRYLETLLACESSDAHWATFLLPLGVLPGGPTGTKALAAAIAPIAFALGEKIPFPLLTLAEQKRALSTFEFWPKPVGLLAFFAPTLNRLINRASALRRIVNAPRREERGATPPLEREAVREGLRALASELKAKEPPPPRIEAKHLDPAIAAKLRADIAAKRAAEAQDRDHRLAGKPST